MRKLTQAEITSLLRAGNPGTYNISDYLYLRIQRSGEGTSASYVFRWQAHGAARWRSIGPVRKTSLAQARELSARWQADIFAGRQPGDKPVEKVTFADLLAEALPGMTRKLTLASGQDFKRSLEAASSYFSKKPVQLITVADVASYLKPHWGKRSADKWRARIKRVFDAAVADGIISVNPAMLPPIKSKLGDPNRETENYLALPLDSVPQLFKRLEHYDHGRRGSRQAALALQLIILMACRASEILKSDWREFDLKKELFTLPASRCKSRREHVVPLTWPVLSILEELGPRASGRLFNLNDHACLFLLRELEPGQHGQGHTGYTVHGFRSCFGDYCDSIGVSSYIIECCLNHVAPTRTMQAYKRSQQLYLRLDALWKWSCFVTGKDWKAEQMKGELALAACQ